MKIAVVDDELKEQNTLKTIISNWAEAEKIPVRLFSYASGEEFLSSEDIGSLDMVFMDVYMSGINGAETAAKLRLGNKRCMIIFLTSSSEHMKDAFSVHAFDYILKPAEKEHVFSILSEAASIFSEKQPYMTVNSGRQELSVFYSDIRSITADSQYCIVYTEESIRCRISFTEISELLSGDKRFLIINRVILVNLDFVRDMENTMCNLTNGQCFPLNTRRKNQLRQELTNYRFECRRRRMQKGGI